MLYRDPENSPPPTRLPPPHIRGPLKAVLTPDSQPGHRIHLFQPQSFQWNRATLPIPSLPAALDGLRILHLSDLHLRPRWYAQSDRLLDKIEESRPDLVLFTGDFIDNRYDCRRSIPSVTRFFSQLSAPLGVFAIFGNHDQSRRTGPQVWNEYLAPLPLTLIDGDRAMISVARSADGKKFKSNSPSPGTPGEGRGGGKLEGSHGSDFAASPLPNPPPEYRGREKDLQQPSVQEGEETGHIELIGLPGLNYDTLKDDFLAAIPSRPENAVRIVLSHYPSQIIRLEPHAPDLFLTGHTHGGQCCLPGGFPLITHDPLPRRYSKGIHRWKDQTWMIISRGFGFSGLPLRVLCEPEVMEITLSRAELRPE